jgi:hypothetical protein
MSNWIIETIGKWGVKTTDAQVRFNLPRPGDVIDFGDFHGKYPFTSGRYGRISSWQKPYRDTYNDKDVPGQWSVCCGGASCFLGEFGQVDISGGPFTGIRPEDLEPMYSTKRVRFWNWGDNGPGGGHGVDYYIDRPVFLLVSYRDPHERA